MIFEVFNGDDYDLLTVVGQLQSRSSTCSNICTFGRKYHKAQPWPALMLLQAPYASSVLEFPKVAEE